MMNAIIQKLTSRKMWAAITAAVMCVITAVFGENIPAEFAEYIRTGAYALIAYVFGEAAVDVAREIAKGKTDQGAVNVSDGDTE